MKALEERERVEREAKEAQRERDRQEAAEAEEKRLAEEAALKAALALSNLPDEPASDDAAACHLVFRLPVTGERVSRRFLKTDNIG